MGMIVPNVSIAGKVKNGDAAATSKDMTLKKSHVASLDRLNAFLDFFQNRRWMII